ncbi:DMT family transporter [Oceanospirillum sp. D5]|uniref:DMT family transporter n=2 Tax=Oceanospirillum sediminis TaxID=2760088 RepID=A0A839INV2_9GAMM|nr:DMT family transporter [Oceanospirillum sediminis]
MQRSLIIGAGLILISEMFLVLSGMTVKYIADDMPVQMIVFFRNFLGILLLVPWLMSNGLSAIRTQKLRFHFMRAGVGVVAMTCLFYSWGHLPLAQAALIKQTAPFFIPVIALIWLGERISTMVKFAIVVGFLGTVFVLNPQDGAMNLAVLIALAGAMLGALAKVTIRRMRDSESPQRIVFYFAFFSAILSAGPATLVWQPVTMIQLFWLLVMAAASTLAQLFLSKAYGMAPAGQLGPFTYGSVAFAALMGWWLWSESLEMNTIAGIVLITLGGVLAVSGPGAKAKS